MREWFRRKYFSLRLKFTSWVLWAGMLPPGWSRVEEFDSPARRALPYDTFLQVDGYSVAYKTNPQFGTPGWYVVYGGGGRYHAPFPSWPQAVLYAEARRFAGIAPC